MAPRLGKDRITASDRKVVRAVLSGKTLEEAGKAAGLGNTPGSSAVLAHRAFKKVNELGLIEKALDEAGATLEASARVIAEAHKAKKKGATKFGVVDLGPDHPTRLKAAEMNGKYRKILNAETEQSGVVMNVGFFVMKGLKERGLEGGLSE